MGIAGLVNKPTTPINDESGNVSIAWDLFFTGLATGVLSYAYYAPLTGFSIQMPNGVDAIVLNPSGTLATGAIQLPLSATDGQVVRLITSQTITALTLTVAPNSGQTLINGVTTLSASGASYIFIKSIASWVRCQ